MVLYNYRGMDVVTYSAARKNLKAVMDRVVDDSDFTVITRQNWQAGCNNFARRVERVAGDSAPDVFAEKLPSGLESPSSKQMPAKLIVKDFEELQKLAE